MGYEAYPGGEVRGLRHYHDEPAAAAQRPVNGAHARAESPRSATIGDSESRWRGPGGHGPGVQLRGTISRRWPRPTFRRSASCWHLHRAHDADAAGAAAVVARVHGLATAAGCQLVASADLAVASEDAGFATPGGKGGWFCHTPMVPWPGTWAEAGHGAGHVRRRDRRADALDWGLVNQVVPAGRSSTPRSRTCWSASPGLGGEQGHGQAGAVRQIDLDQPKAYAYAVESWPRPASCRTRANGRGPSWRSASRTGARPAVTGGTLPARSRAWSKAFIPDCTARHQASGLSQPGQPAAHSHYASITDSPGHVPRLTY